MTDDSTRGDHDPEVLEPVEIRQEIQDAIVRDILGPAEGPFERFSGVRPSARYLVGRLAPVRIDDADPIADSVEAEGNPRGDLGGEGEGGSEEGEDDGRARASRSAIPSSMGLTFAVDAGIERLEIEVSWGRYLRVGPEEEGGEGTEPPESGGAGDPPTRFWEREPRGGTIELDLAGDPQQRHSADPDQEDVRLVAWIRPTREGQRVVSLFLVNEQDEPERLKEQAWVFQPEIVVRTGDDTPGFVRRGSGATSDTERRILDMLYRDHLEFAVGHGVSVHWEVAEEPGRARELRTRVVPEYEVPATDATSPDDHPALEGIELGMRELADLPDDELIAKLSILPDAYDAWIAEQDRRISDGELAGHEDAARHNLERCREASGRIRAGIETLRDHDDACTAFRFASRAMALQRTRGIYSREKRRGKSVEFEDVDAKPENRRWRPFQLGFLLLSLPSIADPLHPERTGDEQDRIADLIWFPTGGGKTEAYLGLTAFTLAIRRLQGEVEGHDGGSGVAVLMRYTLRLLTLQQFQRATALVCAMEVLRREATDAGDDRWGDEVFRIGLWVGARVTPNNTKNAAEAVKAHREKSPMGGGDPAQLASCPWCGTSIEPGRHIDVDVDGRWRTLLYCGDGLGGCAFSKKQAPAEGLPVVVVDEEIYRLVPGLVIATVDKFAQLPWRGEVSALFGRVSGKCDRHGYLTPALEENLKCSGNHPKKGSLPRTTRRSSGPLRPPDLIIQDELHLISGPLGTMVGQYETAIDELCSWEVDGRRVRPKIVASTATVRRAKDQVHSLFWRDVRVFPAPGLDVGNDFFSIRRTVDRKPGRRYLGICSPGSSRPRVLIQAFVAALTAAQGMFERVGAAADPWMTVVGYFNSIRELGGTVRLLEDDVKTQAYRVERAFPRPGLRQRNIGEAKELTSRLTSSQVPEILDHLEVPYERPVPKGAKRAIDAVLATNMISVGVDVDRLGLMIVNGQPKTTSEYIQASSRVGRSSIGPGLVLTILNWARPRDMSHYETFEHYHATFYAQVEALSVTPFAARALDRGMTGLLTGLVRHGDPSFNPDAGAEQMTDVASPAVRTPRDSIVGRVHGVTQSSQARTEVEEALDRRLEEWRDEATKGGAHLQYRKPRSGQRRGTVVPWLEMPTGGSWSSRTAPTSMREVEPSVQLLKKDGGGRRPPDWKPAADGSAVEKGGDE